MGMCHCVIGYVMRLSRIVPETLQQEHITDTVRPETDTETAVESP